MGVTDALLAGLQEPTLKGQLGGHRPLPFWPASGTAGTNRCSTNQVEWGVGGWQAAPASHQASMRWLN